jgi:hypothetical protein
MVRIIQARACGFGQNQSLRKSIVMKRILCVLAVLALLGTSVQIARAGGGYCGYGGYEYYSRPFCAPAYYPIARAYYAPVAPVYCAPPVYYAPRVYSAPYYLPPVSFSFGFGYRGYHHPYQRHGHW